MPISWEFRNQALILTVIRGWAGERFPSAIEECIADPMFRPGIALVLDVRKSEVNSSAQEINARARWMAALLSKGLSSHCAILVGPQIFQAGLAMMAEIYLQTVGIHARPFTDLDEALDWLAATDLTGFPAGQTQ